MTLAGHREQVKAIACAQLYVAGRAAGQRGARQDCQFREHSLFAFFRLLVLLFISVPGICGGGLLCFRLGLCRFGWRGGLLAVVLVLIFDCGFGFNGFHEFQVEPRQHFAQGIGTGLQHQNVMAANLTSAIRCAQADFVAHQAHHLGASIVERGL